MELARELYQRLCDVAQIASFIDVDDRELGRRMNAVSALLVRIARQEVVAESGRPHLGRLDRFPSRTSDGIAVAGKVTADRGLGRVLADRVGLLEPIRGDGPHHSATSRLSSTHGCRTTSAAS